jgi:thiamine pyrophosphokinase
MSKAILWCNGDIPSIGLVKSLIDDNVPVFGIDGGADIAKLMKIEIKSVIGDLDSVDIVKWENKTKQIVNQEMSDLGKSINYLLENGMKEVDILGIDGGSPEHILAIWGNLAELSGNIKIRLHHEFRITERIHPNEGQFEIFIDKDEEFSIFALTPCKKLYLKGSKWEIKGNELGLSSIGLHNVGLGNKISIIADGIIALITKR